MFLFNPFMSSQPRSQAPTCTAAASMSRPADELRVSFPVSPAVSTDAVSADDKSDMGGCRVAKLALLHASSTQVQMLSLQVVHSS